MAITKVLTPFNFTDKNDTGRIKYIVIHYFGGMSTAKNLAEYWKSKYVGASAHYAVDHDGKIYQCVADEDIAWHCGANTYSHPECRNSNSIGIEMAVRKKDTKSLQATDKDWYFEEKTVKASIDLVKKLMKKYDIPVDHVIRHNDVTGKCCPNPYVYNNTEHTWKEFIASISGEDTKDKESKEEIKTDETSNNSEDDSYEIVTTCDVLNVRKNASSASAIVGAIKEKAGCKNYYTVSEVKNGWGYVKKLKGWIFLKYTLNASAEEPYQVTTTCDTLNIRAGAGTNYKVVGTISEKAGHKQKYTIVDEENGWGKLKSGIGYVSLAYTKRVS